MLCRREGIVQNLSPLVEDFLEASKERLAGDTARAAMSDEGKGLRCQASALKECATTVQLRSPECISVYYVIDSR
jgi:transposase